MNTNLRCLFILCVLTALLAGCAPASQPAGSDAESNIRKGSFVTGHTLNERDPGSWETGFQVTITGPNQVTGLLLHGTVSEGQVYLRLTDPSGKEAWRSDPVSGSGTLLDLPLSARLEPGNYQLGVGWDAPVRGTLDLYFVPGEKVVLPGTGLSPLVLLPGLGMSLVGLIGFGLVLARRLGLKAAALGAVAWVFTVALKFAWAIPVNPILYQAIHGALPEPAAGTLFNLYVGALTGVFEVGIVWLLGRRYLRGGRTISWNQALAFGIGFGAVEALLLGLLNLVGTLPALLAPDLLPPGTADSLAVYNNPLMGIAPVWERVFVLLLHVASNVLIFFSLRVRKPVFFWLAFIYKTLIDTLAAWGQSGMAGTPGGLWLLEGIIAVFGLVGVWIITWVRRQWTSEPEPDPTPAVLQA